MIVGVRENGRFPVYLTPRQRSKHICYVGATGVGKTTGMELPLRQDLRSRRGVAVIDPISDLYNRSLNYYCYLRAVGYALPEVIPLNFTQPDWVSPWNPFVRGAGDIAVQVDRRISATLRAWGQHTGDQTPTLERLLRVTFHVVIEKGLTLLEAQHLLDFHADEVTRYLLTGLGPEPIAREWRELRGFSTPAQWREEVLSCKNRLMRFWCSDVLRRSMGVGTNVLDYHRIMDQGVFVPINLGPSPYFSPENARLVGNTILTGFIEAAMERPTGAPPYYLYIDEASMFAIPELAQALDMCRKKGLHLIFGFQHLAQFRAEDEKLYKSIKNNARTKIVFAVPDRQDATELADDLFAGLTELQVKFLHRRLNHLVRDVRETSTSRSRGHSTSNGAGESESEGSGDHEDVAESVSASTQRSRSKTVTDARAESRERGVNGNRSQGTSHSHSLANSQGGSHVADHHASRSYTSSSGSNEAQTALPNGDKTQTTGHSENSSVTIHETDFSVDTYTWSDTESEATTKNAVIGSGWSRSRGVTKTRGVSNGETQGESETSGHSTSRGRATSRSRSVSRTKEHGTNENVSVTDQPGAHHIPFWEEDPEHWTLEEQRWKAAELLMRQPTGHCFISVDGANAQPATIPKPKPFYIREPQLLRLIRQAYERHSLPAAEADRLIQERQQKLLEQAHAQPDVPAPDTRPHTRSKSVQAPIWDRAAGGDSVISTGANQPHLAIRPASRRKRGPKPDVENHAKVARIVSSYSDGWTTDDNLIEICEKLDREVVPVPKTWPVRPDGKSRSWRRGYENYAHLVVKAIKDRLKMAGAQNAGPASKLPQSSAAP